MLTWKQQSQAQFVLLLLISGGNRLGWFCLHSNAMFWGRPAARGQTQLFISDGQEPALQYQSCLYCSELNSHHSQVLAGYPQIKPVLGKAFSSHWKSSSHSQELKKNSPVYLFLMCDPAGQGPDRILKCAFAEQCHFQILPASTELPVPQIPT